MIDLSSLRLAECFVATLSFFSFSFSCRESIGIVFAINAPPIFQAFWRVIKPVIPPRTLNRIHFLGHNYRETLLDLIPAENLPVSFLPPPTLLLSRHLLF